MKLKFKSLVVLFLVLSILTTAGCNPNTNNNGTDMENNGQQTPENGLDNEGIDQEMENEGLDNQGTEGEGTGGTGQ